MPDEHYEKSREKKRYKIVIIAIDGLLDMVMNIVNNEHICISAILTLKTEKLSDILRKYNINCPVYRYDNMPEVLRRFHYDYILLATSTYEKSISQILECGINKNKILNLIGLAGMDMISLLNLMKNYLTETREYTTLITGISYTYYASDMEIYGENTLNLSGISQDLFYDYQLAKLAIEGQRSFFKHAIIGIAPYSLHYDMSKGQESYRSFMYYPILKTMHNYHLKEDVSEIFNKNYTELFSTVDSKLKFDWKDRLNHRRFPHINYKLQESTIIVGRERAELWKNKEFPISVAENKNILRAYLSLCEKYKIHAVLVLFPVSDIYYQWCDQQKIDELYFEIEKLSMEFELEFLNFFQDKRFSYNDFFDVDHLNPVGAKKISMIIRDTLK